jgi:hypothetical protein
VGLSLSAELGGVGGITLASTIGSGNKLENTSKVERAVLQLGSWVGYGSLCNFGNGL